MSASLHNNKGCLSKMTRRFKLRSDPAVDRLMEGRPRPKEAKGDRTARVLWGDLVMDLLIGRVPEESRQKLQAALDRHRNGSIASHGVVPGAVPQETMPRDDDFGAYFWDFGDE